MLGTGTHTCTQRCSARETAVGYLRFVLTDTHKHIHTRHQQAKQHKTADSARTSVFLRVCVQVFVYVSLTHVSLTKSIPTHLLHRSNGTQ